MSKNIKRDTRALQTTYDNYKNRLTHPVRTNIQNLSKFYEDRKIAQFTNADNLMRQFITAKTRKQKTKQRIRQNPRQTPRQRTTRATNAGSKEGKQKTKYF